MLVLPLNLICCLSSLYRLIIGADGANSQVRKLGGFGSWGWGYGQEAVVCTVKVTARDPARELSGLCLTGLDCYSSTLFIQLYSY